MRLTIACPELMRDDANNLAMAKEGEGGEFSPASLFAGGQQGLLFKPER